MSRASASGSKRRTTMTKQTVPRFGARFCGCPVGSARRPGPASLPPSFLSSSPATVRSARTGAVKETSDGLVRPAAQRGHGPARLDGTRARATVADEVMSEGRRRLWQRPQMAPTLRKRSAQARIGEAGPKASAERSEGTMEARMGRDAEGGSMRSTTARPAMLPGRGRPYTQAARTPYSRHRLHAVAAVRPIRRSRFGCL